MRLFAKKAGFILQLCWAHILQDSKELAIAFGAEGVSVHKRLKEIYAIATGFNHQGNYQIVEQLNANIPSGFN